MSLLIYKHKGSDLVAERINYGMGYERNIFKTLVLNLGNINQNTGFLINDEQRQPHSMLNDGTMVTLRAMLNPLVTITENGH